MRTFKLSLQIIFYVLIFALFVSRSASSAFTHDENQFIAAGQLLADHGLLPYLDYPYTHMPYGVAFYALSASISNYDFLAGRLLNALAWVLCSLLIPQTVRLIAKDGKASLSACDPTFPQLLAEFVLVFVFLNHPIMGHIDGPALNHSYATLFGLLAILLFARLVGLGFSSSRVSFVSGLFASLAAFIRLNYAALAVVLLLVLLLHAATDRSSRRFSAFPPFIAGLVAAGVPAVVLAALAPEHFLYTNLIYIRLNTIYYQEMGFKLNMTLSSKLQSFAGLVLGSPIDIILYAVLVFFGVVAVIRFVKTRSSGSLIDLALAGFAATLAVSAFAPTPTQPQYFFAPLPFLLVILGVLGLRLAGPHPVAFTAASLVVLAALFASVKVVNPLSEITFLASPSKWTPIQIHSFDETLKGYVPDGRFLSLLPMLPLEAGYDVYPFTAAGGFPWRTSLLLTSERRAQYGVTSPRELLQILDHDAPIGILTGLESTNDGFVRNDLGGLEAPFVAYATSHGYEPIPLQARFLRRTVTLWVKQP